MGGERFLPTKSLISQNMSSVFIQKNKKHPYTKKLGNSYHNQEGFNTFQKGEYASALKHLEEMFNLTHYFWSQ